MEVYEQVAKSTRRVTVANYTGHDQHFDISTSFRFADDEDNGAVSVDHPGRVKVPAYGTTEFLVTAYVDGAALRHVGNAVPLSRVRFSDGNVIGCFAGNTFVKDHFIETRCHSSLDCRGDSDSTRCSIPSFR